MSARDHSWSLVVAPAPGEGTAPAPRTGEPELLTIAEAARWLGVSVSTLRRWQRRGVVPYVRFPVGHYRARTIRYRLQDLRRLAEDHLCVDQPGALVQNGIGRPRRREVAHES